MSMDQQAKSNQQQAVAAHDALVRRAAERSERLGAWMLAGLLLSVLSFNISMIVLTMLMRQSGPQPSQILRVILEMTLFVFVMVGHAWARWLTIALFGIAALIAFAALGSRIGSDPPDVFGAILMGCLGVFYLLLLLSLVVPGPITRYLASRRA
jgi:hypothetical protein